MAQMLQFGLLSGAVDHLIGPVKRITQSIALLRN